MEETKYSPIDPVTNNQTFSSQTKDKLNTLEKPVTLSLTLKSLRIFLSLCSPSSLLILYCILFLNIISSTIPLLYSIQTSSLIQEMSDNFDDRDEFYDAIKPISYSLLIFGGIYFIISTLATFLIFYFSRVQGILWRKAYFQSLLEKDAGFFDLNPEATSGNNISEECRYIEEAFGDDLMLFISSISLFLALWIASLFYSLELTLFSLIIFPAQYVGVMLMNVRSPSSHQTRMKMYSSAQLISEETLENSKTVASLNCQEPRIQEYSESLKPLESSRIREGINEGIGWGTMFSVLFAATGVMFYVATVYISEEKDTWAQGEMDMLDMMVVYYCFFNGSSLIGISSNSLNKILRGIASANRIKGIIGEKGEKNVDIKMEDDSWGIQIEKAEFNYPSKPEVQVLRSISFNIGPGEKIGLVGATGCGKSTIAQLLLGFYKCSSGCIKFNDVHIEDLDIKFLRNYISYVNQEPLLYSTTIIKNIKLGKQNCSEEEIIDAVRCAEAYEFHTKYAEKTKQLCRKQRLSAFRWRKAENCSSEGFSAGTQVNHSG